MKHKVKLTCLWR